MSSLFWILALAAATPAAPSAPPGEGSASGGPWLDWSELSRQSSAAEAAGLDSPANTSSPEALAKARELGDRVGRIVAAGDCAEGERLARAAGDMGLARAVRVHCYR